MKPCFLIFFIGMLAASLGAEEPGDAPKVFDLTTTYGETYRNCRILKVTPETITLMHDQGVSKVGFELLGDEWKQKFNYDPVKAKAHAEAERQKREAAEAVAKTQRDNRERNEKQRMAELAAQEKKEIDGEARLALARAEAAAKSAAEDRQSVVPAPMEGPPMPGAMASGLVHEVESVVPVTAPIHQIFTPGTTHGQRFIFRESSGYLPAGTVYFSSYSPGCTPYPAYLPQPRPSFTGSIRFGNSWLQINR